MLKEPLRFLEKKVIHHLWFSSQNSIRAYISVARNFLVLRKSVVELRSGTKLQLNLISCNRKGREEILHLPGIVEIPCLQEK